MAETYQVTTYSNVETQGDQFTWTDFSGNTPGALGWPILEISPIAQQNPNDTTYTVSAVNFSISGGTPTNNAQPFEYWNGMNGVVLPDEVEYVTMQDSGQPGQPGNVIGVVVYMNPSFSMPAADTLINIDIDGFGEAWEPEPIYNDGNYYAFGIYLTNSMWPGGNSYYMAGISGPGEIPNDGTIAPHYDENGDVQFGIANYTEETNINWNEYEAQGKQNPYAIPNCIIQQENSPVQAPVADTLDDNGVGYSWVSEAVGGGGIPSVGFAEVDPPCFWRWTIKPISPQWKVSSEDFHIMTRDVQQMTANYNYDPNANSMFSSGVTAGYPSGFAYYDDWGDDINGNPNPYLHGSNGTWDFGFADQIGATDDNGYLVLNPNNPPSGSNGIGEALLYTSPNPNGLFPEDFNYGEGYFDYWQGWIENGACENTDEIAWPSLTSYMSTSNPCDVENLVNAYSQSLGTWSNNEGACVDIVTFATAENNAFSPIFKHYAKPMVFVEENPTNNNSYSWQDNIGEDTFNYEWGNPYGPPPITKMSVNGETPGSEEEAYDLYWGGNNFDTDYPFWNDQNTGCWGPESIINRAYLFDTNPGENDNVITVVLEPCAQDWFDSAQNMNFDFMKRLFLQINGKATPAGQGAPPPPVNFGFNLVNTKNSGTINITKTQDSRIKESTERSGFSDEVEKHYIFGRIPNNTKTKIATISIEADDGMYFDKIPYMTISDVDPNANFELNKNLELTLVESTSNTSYTFDLKYRNKKDVLKVSDVNVNINFTQKTIAAATYEIRDISFGNSIIKTGGGSRSITVYGKPSSPFTLSISSIDELLDSDNNIVNITEESILNGSVVNSTKTNNRGNTIKELNGVLNSKGKYSFNQKFPNTTIINTAINGSMAASGATKIIFDDLTGVRVGDKIIMNEITNSVITVTALNPDGDNENECTVSASITAADNARASFIRSKKYRIYIKPGSDTIINTSSSIINWDTDIEEWEDYYSKTINQYLNPVLTLRASTADGAGVVTMNSATWNNSTPYDLTYIGRPNTLQSKISGFSGVPSDSFTITYLLDLVAGGRNFAYIDTDFPKPIFKNNSSLNDLELLEYKNQVADTTIDTIVDWTNSNPKHNGGTEINISKITISAAGANTITVTAFVRIIKWGTKDVTMDLNLSNIVSHA